MLRGPSKKHSTVKKGHKGQVRGVGGFCRVAADEQTEMTLYVWHKGTGKAREAKAGESHGRARQVRPEPPSAQVRRWNLT